MTPELRARIQKAIDENEVILFMKGTRQAPSCGFSSSAVEVLDSILSHYATVDVLTHADVRDAIKEFSSWPTIPQLYVRGQFFGGADLMMEMFEAGELHEKLGAAPPSAAPPKITVTEAAKAALVGYLSGSDEIVLLDIDKTFQAGLSIGPRPASAINVDAGGIPLAMDRLSATRAEGLTIDFVETPEGQAFKIDNPNEPAKVKPLSVSAFAARQKAGVPQRLIDVRTPGEFATASITGAELLDEALEAELLSLPKETSLVFQCHHGMRSERAAERFVAQGFREVFNLTGGIDAWSQEIDQNVPRY